MNTEPPAAGSLPKCLGARWNKALVVILALATLVGCQGLSSGHSSTQQPVAPAGQLTLSSSALDFSSVVMGSNKTLTVTATNSGNASLTVTSATSSAPQFSWSGPDLPITIAVGQNATLSITFTPSAAANASGTISISSNASSGSASVALSGAGVAPGLLQASPASTSFVNVGVGRNQSQPATLTNSGGSTVTVSQAAVSGTGFSLSGLTIPLTLAAGQSASFNLVFTPQAAGSVNGNVAFTSNASNPTLNLPLSGTALAAGIPATFFGMHINWASTPWPNVPVGSQRLWDTETGWSQINTAAGVYDWTTLDARVHAALAANADVLYDLARTPGWAQCSNSDTSCGSGDRTIICNYANMTGEAGPGQCFPPNDLKTDGSGTNQHWVDWVTAVATRYKGQIKYYEIWNEPTISTMWQGSDAQLVRMTQDAHCIIAGTGCSSQSTYTQTGIDPSAGVTTPAFVSAPGGLDVGPALDNYLNAGGGPYVDVIAFHAYVAYLSHQPELVVSETASVQSVMASYSQQNKPVFNTEGGWGAQKSMPDPDLQASWLARYHILQQSSGLARSYWYSWDGIVTPLWSKTGGTEAGGATFGEIQNWLVGATLSSACSSQGTVWTCGYTRTGGYQALAVWDTAQSCNAGTCTTSSFTIPAGFVYSLDLTGIKTQLSGSTVQIGLKPILLENQ